nr:CCR4-Not complex component, Not1, C-terminal [Tanacetum cinerariifolium]
MGHNGINTNAEAEPSFDNTYPNPYEPMRNSIKVLRIIPKCKLLIPICLRNVQGTFASDALQNSFDCPPDSYHPPYPTYETYSGDSCGNDSHFGYDCPPQFPLNYELELGYIQNYNSYPHDSPSFPQQYPCCEDCRREEKRIEEEQAAKAQTWKLPVCYDDDDEEEGYNSLNDNIISELPPYFVVTPTEPIDSLSMGDEHLDTIPATESDEFIKSCVENLVPNPSESEGENGCDVLACFTTFSNVLFDVDYDSDSSVDQSLSDEDIDSLFDAFAGELTLLKSIPPGIIETDCHPEKEIRLAKRLLYDNSSPRLPKEIVSENSNADIESFSPFPIPNLDSDPHMEEIDLPFTPDDPLPPGIEDDDYDSRRDIPILEELLDNYSLSLSANESYHFDIPSPYRPPAKPPYGNTGTLNIKMLGQAQRPKTSASWEATHAYHPIVLGYDCGSRGEWCEVVREAGKCGRGFLGDGEKNCALHSVLNVGYDRDGTVLEFTL